MNKLTRRKFIDTLQLVLLWLCGAIAVGFLLLILIYVLSRGIPNIHWAFLSTVYKPGLGSSGIREIIVGTLAMIGLTLLVAVPVGVLAAIYMAEYAQKGKVLSTIRFCVESLAGIPSILYGLFGYTFFVIQCALGFSLISSALTLAIMVLPVIIRSTEEALFTVPNSYREGSLALGASKLTTLFRVVLPCAIPGILSAIILSMGRVMGETAAVYLHRRHHGQGAAEHLFLDALAGRAPVPAGQGRSQFRRSVRHRNDPDRHHRGPQRAGQLRRQAPEPAPYGR